MKIGFFGCSFTEGGGLNSPVFNEYAIKNKLIWPAFEEALEVKQETLTHHWRDFSNLRNTKFHSNEPHTEGALALGVGATKMIRSFAARALKKLSTDSED